MSFNFDPARYAGLPLDSVRREVGDQIERMIEYLDNLDPWDEREDENEYGDVLDAMEGDGLENGEGCESDHEGDGDCDSEPWLGWTVSGNFGNNTDLEENGDEHDYSGSGPVPNENTELCWHPQGGARIAQELLRKAGLHMRPTVQMVEIVSSTGQRAMLEITL